MGKEFTVEGDPLPQMLPGPSKPWTLSSSFGAAISLGAGSTGPRLGSVGTLWHWREVGLARDPPLPPHTPPRGRSRSTDRLCAESRGASKGELRPLELVSQPQFLSVVLKE